MDKYRSQTGNGKIILSFNVVFCGLLYHCAEQEPGLNKLTFDLIHL
jgi:hypothetical protein